MTTTEIEALVAEARTHAVGSELRARMKTRRLLIQLADALEAAVKEQRTLGLAWEPGSCVIEDDGCAILDRYHDAARASTKEK